MKRPLFTNRHIRIVAILLILLTAVNSFGQETKRKKVHKGKYIEEYYVLKENKEVRHGQYVRYTKDVLDRKLPLEIGFYEDDEKVGEWYSLYPNGALKEFGNYEDSKKNGIWIEYYAPGTCGESFTSLFEIHQDIKVDENGAITVVKKEVLISAMGEYKRNKEIGVWNYYTRSGDLLHIFDKTSDSLLFSSVHDSVNRKCPYLGGFERFYRLFVEKEEVFENNTSLLETIVVLRLEVIDNILNVIRISSFGDENFAQKIEKNIKLLPDDWMKSYLEKPILFVWRLKRDSNKTIFNAAFKEPDDHNI